MYNELVKALRNMSKMGTKYGMAVVKMREAADAIEELCGLCASQSKDCSEAVAKYLELWAKQPRWIPVTERLPKYGDWVLGIGPKRGYHVCEYRGITHFPYSGDIPWFSAKGRSLNITHWMPLPEPPKEGTE